jgi:hypothetical protein
MKKYFLALIMLFTMAFMAHAQFAQEVTFAGSDTVVNTATVYTTLTLKKAYDSAVFTLTNSEVSGAAAGTTYLQAKCEGSNWTTLDSLVNTDKAVNYKHFVLTKVPYTYYRFKYTGTGTMSVITAAVATVKRL